jgi:hypothetical protein
MGMGPATKLANWDRVADLRQRPQRFHYLNCPGSPGVSKYRRDQNPDYTVRGRLERKEPCRGRNYLCRRCQKPSSPSLGTTGSSGRRGWSRHSSGCNGSQGRRLPPWTVCPRSSGRRSIEEADWIADTDQPDWVSRASTNRWIWDTRSKASVHREPVSSWPDLF